MQLSSCIREVRDYIISRNGDVDCPADVNNGYCSQLATNVANKFDDSVRVLELQREGRSHVWISYNGKHFDAEVPDGVREWQNLPFFERHPAETGQSPIDYPPAQHLVNR